jgi:hypothetical protein
MDMLPCYRHMFSVSLHPGDNEWMPLEHLSGMYKGLVSISSTGKKKRERERPELEAKNFNSKTGTSTFHPVS